MMNLKAPLAIDPGPTQSMWILRGFLAADLLTTRQHHSDKDNPRDKRTCDWPHPLTEPGSSRSTFSWENKILSVPVLEQGDRRGPRGACPRT